MRGNRFRGAWLLAAWLLTAPSVVLGQGPGYAPAYPQVPLPLGSTRPEDGGFWVSGGVLFLRQNNPLKSQTVAVRGFQVYDQSLITILSPRFNTTINRTFQVFPDGTIGLINTASNRTQPATFIQALPGQFFGSGVEALNVDQLTGQDSYQTGFTMTLGWKFDDGSAVSFNWKYLTEAQYRAGATLAPRGGAVGVDLADSFLFSPVFNFPPEYAGADNKITVPGPVGSGATANAQPTAQAAFGIWNAASIQTIEFRQRFQQYDITYREPIYETEDYRINGLVGPRYAWIWERFKWRTTSIGQDINGFVADTGPDNVAVYTNITSNRMYGAFTGCEQELYLGRGFAVHLKTEAALFVDSVKERAKYELANRYAGRPENKRSKREWSVVPGFNAAAGLQWYPTEFIQLYAGYEFMSFINTFASRRPIDFDYANLAPKWSKYTRVFDGFNVNLAFRF